MQASLTPHLNTYKQAVTPLSSLQTTLQRTVCLQLKALPKLKPAHRRSSAAIAEAFLRFSPRVQFRAPHWLFVEVSSTAHLFGGETLLLNAMVSFAKDLGFQVRAAMADTPYGAQVFAHSYERFISSRGEQEKDLRYLPLTSLLHLEGLSEWEYSSRLDQMISFLFMLGFSKLGELERFEFASFKERWGELGEVVWRRLRTRDEQVVSPTLPTEPLTDYAHLDFPLSLVSLLLHQMEKSLHFLFARLEGRCLFATKMQVHLHCEYSKTQHTFNIEPANANRDPALFINLLEFKLGTLDLENPIREFEIELFTCPEKVQQLDFFEGHDRNEDKLSNLLSMIKQASIVAGVMQVKEALLPEESWSTHSTPNEARSRQEIAAHLLTKFTAQSRQAKKSEPQNEQAYRLDPCYGKSVMTAPRPTRILKQPMRIARNNFHEMKLLTRNPIERIEDQWWEADVRRDYYFAVSPLGQCLWVYRDLKNQDYFLHGYFD